MTADQHIHTDDDHGTLDLHAFTRKAIQFLVTIGVADETFVLVNVAFPDGTTLYERFAGSDHVAVVREARGFCYEIIDPTERPVYGSPEWEVEVEAELLRAEMEEAWHGR